jgi:hypothetical protein
MKVHFCFLVTASVFLSAFQQGKAQADFSTPALPSIPNKIFTIKDFGAVSYNRTDNTQAIQKAINAAGSAGGRKGDGSRWCFSMWSFGVYQ